MASQKRKLQIHKIETKYRAILDVEAGSRSKSEVAKCYGIPLSTLSTWVKNAEKTKDAFMANGNARKRVKSCQYPDVEDALFTWFKAARSQNIPISGPILQAKAQSLA